MLLSEVASGPVYLAATGGADRALGTAVEPSKQQAVDWDTAFPDRSGNGPIHFTARYLDGNGQVHRLEEWRLGQVHLRRKTDDRIDLHADAAAQPKPSANQPLAYVWQLIDLQKRIDHRVTTAGMLRLGMLYSYYSMAHVLTRPAGNFTIEHSSDPARENSAAPSPLSTPVTATPMEPCIWWQVNAVGQPARRVCWIARYGIPRRAFVQTAQGWRMDFQELSADTHTIAPGVFQVSTAGLQIRDVDEIQNDD